MGTVGGLVPKLLIEHLGAKLFAEIRTVDKPYVLCKDGLITHDPTVYRLYNSVKGHLVIATGDEQPSDVRTLYALCDSVLDVAGEVGKIKRVYTSGGYYRERLIGEPKVYGVANKRSLLTELDRLGIREIGSEISSITWFNGLILGAAARRGIDAVGLYGELDDPKIPQPRAANSVLKALVTMLSLPEIDAWRARKESNVIESTE